MRVTKSDVDKWLADALEHMYDYSYLGTHPLAHLNVVDRFVIHDQSPLTHVDRGRAVSRLLQAAIAELARTGEPSNVGRESRYYAILYQEYQEGRENREIALNLSISERTFYRERKRALRSLAQVVWDIGHDER
jgi:hypothetical protein